MIKVNKKLFFQVFRFLFTGGLTVTADLFTFAGLRWLDVPLFFSVLGSLLAGLIVSFTLNRIWVFDAKSDEASKSLKWQLTFYILLFIFNTVMTYTFIDFVKSKGLLEHEGKIISMFFITVWNFVIYKLFIFKVKK